MSGSSSLPETFYCTKPIDFSKSVDTSNVKGKSVIVTGGANGIGAACVKAFAEAGAYVTILDINEKLGSALVEGLKNKGYHVQFTKTDITSWESQLSGFKSALTFTPKGDLDIVLTSAGLPGNRVGSTWFDGAISSSSEPEPPTTKVIDVNLTGSFYSAHLALYFFKKSTESGSQQTSTPLSSKQLIFVSSLAGYIPFYHHLDYAASKYGVRGMFKALRHSTSILGSGAPTLRTNLVAPSFIRTGMTSDYEAGLMQIGIELGEVEDVAVGVMRVACDEEITGRAIAIASRSQGGVAGDRNYDLGDDWEGSDGGKAALESLLNGSIKGLELVGYN
ncbi:NAD(P)-binding protein [Lophiostoma macrostomum CBS 122681]|uniref:NAD(P)-binding protein n=1 Tax=Lophiostoma macrostomum CBS 122681 TaxID=1314788 RepID=A0A6A6TNS8_9PLEO|nr:NAD(P)-binding protein [Lophiostoma macrostomum CBS 122681]